MLRKTIAIALLCAATASATTIAPMDLKELPRDATLIVIGYVMTVRTVTKDDRLLEAVATIKVTSVLSGSRTTPSTVRIRLRRSFINFDRWLAPTDSGVFFLIRSDNGQFEAAYPGAFALFEKGIVEKP
ncbi:MAG TPA: hypothetical protein VMU84_09815 [Thermoanaerobaculia bacterium]|nr:hypothetical protein [Thermoanaerobaculia bacterium]